MELLTSTIIATKDEAPGVKTFTLRPQRQLSFSPGQFVMVHASPHGNGIVKRAYSIASAPTKKDFDLTVKLTTQGTMTPWMFELDTGATLQHTKPLGKFIYENEDKIVLIAGGAGIAPLMSIIRFCIDKRLDTEIVLIYSSKAPDDIIYKQELAEAAQHKNITVHHTMTDHDSQWIGHTGRIDKQLIRFAVQDLHQATYFLCGSAAFAKDIGSQLKELGIDRKKIKRDVWG